MSTASAKQNRFLSSEYINGVYIPSGLLVFGCLIVKKEWVPFAVALAALLGGFKIWSSRQ
jgi:cytochrome-b5 reductase